MILNLYLFLITYGEYSSLALTSYLLIFTSLLSFGLVQFSNFTDKPHPFRTRFAQTDLGFSEDSVNGHSRAIFSVLENLRVLLRDALYWTDPFYSLKMFALFIVLALAGNYLSLATIAYFRTHMYSIAFPYCSGRCIFRGSSYIRVPAGKD